MAGSAGLSDGIGGTRHGKGFRGFLRWSLDHLLQVALFHRGALGERVSGQGGAGESSAA